MTKRWMAVLALCLAAPAAFGQETAAAKAPVKTLRAEIKRDQGDVGAKWKTERQARHEIRLQHKADLARLRGEPGTRAEKQAVRAALKTKYAGMIRDVHEKGLFEKKNLREDMTSKRSELKKLQIKKMRQS